MVSSINQSEANATEIETLEENFSKIENSEANSTGDKVVMVFNGSEMDDVIELYGNLVEFHAGTAMGAPDYWTVDVVSVISGPELCCNKLDVIAAQAVPGPWGFVDFDLSPGDEVEVRGAYSEDESGCRVTLRGSESYFIRVLEAT